MRFAYKQLEVVPSPASPRTKTIWRPIIPMTLKHNQVIVVYEALIDSGSDYNVFEGQIADILGIPLTQGRKRQIVGLGDQVVKGYEHPLELIVAGKRYQTQVIFSNQLPSHTFGVLGQQGFFGHFVITFDYKNKAINVG